MTDYIYDIETYPNIFTCCIKNTVTNDIVVYEISDRVDHSQHLFNLLQQMHHQQHRMVGFNNNHFDYPIIHLLLLQHGNIDAYTLYLKCTDIINSNNSIGHIIWDNQQHITQVDLFKIHHFDNKSRRTSLKICEFNMRSHSVEDLPFPPGTYLTHEQMDILIHYNKHDVNETHALYNFTLPAIRFRESLLESHDLNAINYNDTKIGKQYFITKLQEHGVECYHYVGRKKEPRQTKRSSIDLSLAVFDYVEFMSPEFTRVKEYFQNQVIKKTKGLFDDLECTVNNFTFSFGLGGIHGSINNRIVRSDDEYTILDLDVTSYYPELAIKNKVFPEHLGEKFCDIYNDVMSMRKKTEKGTLENALLKLALNGVYGDTNNMYSPFYDPLYTMTITINGQLLLCMLAEHLMNIPKLTLLQVNTDGLTIRIKNTHIPLVEVITDWWMKKTKLTLETNYYSAMYIRDVNAYFAVKDNKVVKRKGPYRHEFNPPNINIGKGDLDWNQDHGALVVPKIAEQLLTNGMFNIDELLTNHSDIFDFCLRTKVPRNSSLVSNDPLTGDTPLQNTCRYIVTEKGGSLFKVMPPTTSQIKDGKTDFRRIGVNVGWKVTPCNDIQDATAPLNKEFYKQEIEKLVLPLQELN